MKNIVNLWANIRKRNPAAYRNVTVTIKVMSPLAIIIFLSLYFHEFVLEAIEKDLAISGTIISVCFYGVVIILQKLISAQRDFQVIERFGKEAQSGMPMQQLLEEPWIRERYVRHYLKHVAQTGGLLTSQLDQNAIENELHALQEDYNSKLEFPQFLVGFMIAMGLLGTFIGLLETLTGISEMLGGMGSSTVSAEEQFKNLVSELRKPLAGMGIAFSASMFGLVASLMLSIMMTNLRHFISRVVMCARNVMHELVQINRKAYSNQTTSGGRGADVGGGENNRMGDSGEFERERSARSKSVDALLASRMDSLIRKLEFLFKSFEVSIEGTKRLNELLGFGPRMKETGENTLEELRSLSAAANEQQRFSQQLVDSQLQLVNTIASILDTQRRSQADVSSSFKVMADKTGSIEKAIIGSGKHLHEIKENLTNFGAVYTMMESISSGVGHQTILLEEILSGVINSRDSTTADDYYDENLQDEDPVQRDDK